MNNDKKKKKMDIISKMTIIGVLGLAVILIVVFAMVFGGGKKKNTNNKVDQETEIPVDNNDVGRDIEYERALGVVQKVDTVNDTLTIFNIDSDESATLNMDSAVDIQDEYGSLMTLVQFNKGDMIETKYDKDKMRPEYVHKTAKTWKRNKINGAVVDKEKSTITIGNDKYNYTGELVTIFNGNPFDINDLTEEDEVTLLGYKDIVWTIIMENGHGYIQLKNHSNFIGGTLQIGTNKTVDIKDVTLVPVPVGVHDIIVTNDQATYETEVMVDKDQKVVVNVKDATPKKGMVQFSVTQEGVSFSINGEVYSDFSEPIPLDYGNYTVKVVKDNYVDWEKELVVNKSFTTFEINLEKKPTYIHVDSPVGVDIYIDGNYIGEIPITTPINPGEHTITLRKDGYYSTMHQLEIEDNGEDAYYTLPKLSKIDKDLINDPNNGPTTPDNNTDTNINNGNNNELNNNGSNEEDKDTPSSNDVYDD
ncbi:PEGA domain-containing protein [Vallitalea guaymasensis]|uniref:PEGA domain-containing protein n=1 Tax=Vallitalea guaymasensis TaxID=1185412 RepID=UPI002357CE7E|nr:PEGA domain-containing protein [Vallitalea guaymasensis]